MSKSNYSYIMPVSRADFPDDFADFWDMYSPAGYKKQSPTHGILRETLVYLLLAALP